MPRNSNDNFRTALSESGHLGLGSSVAVRSINQRLERAWRLAGPLNLAGVSLAIKHAHFGPGLYPEGEGSLTHRHGQVHLEYGIAGEFTFSGDGQEVTLAPGRGIILLPEQAHQWHCNRPGYMLGILLDVLGSERDAFLQELTDSIPEPMAVFGGAGPAGRIEEMLQLSSDDSGAVWAPEQMGFLLGLWLADVVGQAWPLKGWVKTERVENREQGLCSLAKEFMEANCLGKLRLAEVAQEVGVTSRHLNRLYQQAYGESLGQALGRLRLETARKLLLTDRQLPIKAVAYRCNFSSPAYFTACYHRHFGETPNQARGDSSKS